MRSTAPFAVSAAPSRARGRWLRALVCRARRFGYTNDAAGRRTAISRSSEAFGDLDGDGMPNGWEIRYDLDPRDPSDADLDSDGDGLTNLREYRLGRSPRAGARPARPSLIRSATATTL